MAALKSNGDVELFSTTPVTPVPMTALISADPLPEPELVMVPVLLRDVDDMVIPLAVVLLLSRIKLPEPLILPETVNNAVLLLVKVVPEALTVSPPLIVNAEEELFSVTPVTFEPTAALMVVVPVLEPVLVTVPPLLTLAVVNVMVAPLEALLLIVKLLAPVTPPVNVSDALPLFPTVNVPTLPLVARAMAFEYVPLALSRSVAAAEPLV